MSGRMIYLTLMSIIILLLTACIAQADMPNPASVYCEENGGKLEIRTNTDGDQVGYCIFEDGSECEEWAFYRGECLPGENITPSANMPNPASVYCEENHGTLEIRTDESGGQLGFCLFEDGSECEEWAFYRGECKPGESLSPIADMPNPASVYCEDQGGSVKIETDAEGGQYGLCVFEDGTACEEWAFFRGECIIGGIYPVDVYAEDGCKVFTNQMLGYSFHFPADADITSSGDPNKNITIRGSLVDDEYWPMIFINHSFDRPEYSLPEAMELENWLKEQNLLEGERLEDTTIAGVTAIHLRQNTGPQAYPADRFYFAKDGRIFNIVFLHTGNKEDWTLYDHILDSFQFK